MIIYDNNIINAIHEQISSYEVFNSPGLWCYLYPTKSVSSASVSVFSLRKNSLQGSQGLIHHCLVPYIIFEIIEETKDACGSEWFHLCTYSCISDCRTYGSKTRCTPRLFCVYVLTEELRIWPSVFGMHCVDIFSHSFPHSQ